MEIMLNPPIVANKIIAQDNASNLKIPFLMNRSVGMKDFTHVIMIIKTVQSNTLLTATPLECTQESLYLQDGNYWAVFNNPYANLLKVGQYYKIQLAYKNNNGIGFYSTVSTFKLTNTPSLTIEQLSIGSVNAHSYTYTGVYTNNIDKSEKVYSYEFNLYDNSNTLVATSGEQLHNSATDISTNQSTDTWTTRYGLKESRPYTLVYKVKTINGLEVTSPSYTIVDNQTVASSLFKYCDFVAINNSESACVELQLQPKDTKQNQRKFINGQFVLLRASNEDGYESWYELTRFVLTAHDTASTKHICKDYCVSQGVRYKYALQAFNNEGLYSTREETKVIFTDFEDMFLSDGERQLRIKFNPKVSSFKTTLLESKMDTIGGKYPFFFRNGKVEYKEFPISGLISMLMDEHEEFMSGIQISSTSRKTTPALPGDEKDLPTALTGDNFRREREFKIEVLNWLTNGKPKLFRSPAEGSFIVRLMNTSLSPNDTLSRMLHTFSCTAYEIADYTFENLRKYGMMMDEFLESQELKFYNIYLKTVGSINNLNARMATLHAPPGTEFKYTLGNTTAKAFVGTTGIYTFSPTVLAKNPLMAIEPPNGESGTNYWHPDVKLTYAKYLNYELDSFSYIHSISSKDNISQWIGKNRAEIPHYLGSNDIFKSIGLVYLLSINKRPITVSVTVEGPNADGVYTFKEGDVNYSSGNNELIYYNGYYYDGGTKRLIGTENNINFDVQLREDDQRINLLGVLTGQNDRLPELNCDYITNTGGRIVLTNVHDLDYLWLGNGLYVDIAYQEIEKLYSIELDPNSQIYEYKQKWQQTGLNSWWTKYYNSLKEYLTKEEGGLIIDAI